jgi:pyruvate-formate lyase-activating enzyme
MPRLLFADNRGSVFVHPALKACGMKAGRFFALRSDDLVKLPSGSRLFMLPRRAAVGLDPDTGAFVSSRALAVAAFLPPGYTATYNSAYMESGRPRALPLFSYAAAASFKGAFYAAGVRVDRDIRHDARLIDLVAVRDNARAVEKRMRGNRLVPHLKGCALVHGCPNAQNFFLGRFECPLPTSPSCNAACAGCISYQKGRLLCAAQPRIAFVPTAREVAEIAVFHIARARDPIVSFGQGCEGEPLTRARLVEESIRLIRKATPKGVINMNTNASMPAALRRLFDAGLGSIRVSMNSCRRNYYERYYRPSGYSFGDVLASIGAAKRSGVFVSLNYLTMPGFTDCGEEFASLRSILGKRRIDMVQWRNLNYDPLRYFEEISARIERDDMLGIKEEIALLKKEFPKLRMGYFNPVKL